MQRPLFLCWWIVAGCLVVSEPGANCLAADRATSLAAQEQAQQLVRELGSGSFRVRQRASRQLMELGVPAKDALIEGLKSSDAEIRDRCRRVLVGVLEEDYQARVDAFEADRQGRHEHHLPGWERFRTVAGQA